MDPNAARASASARKVLETMKTLITKGRCKDASDCIKMAMEVYPTSDILKGYGFALLIISETLHYGNIYLSKCDRFDLYAVLHLHPSSTQEQVIKRFKELKKEVFKVKNTMITFPGASQAEFLLSLANAVLHYKDLRAEFDSERKDCVFLDWPAASNNKTTTLREIYLNWKPPIYHVDATIDHGVKPYVSPELRIPKRKAFDELPPQNQCHDNKKVCQGGMILSSEFAAYSKLCEEIRNLAGVQNFWKSLDGFNEQLSQLKKLGCNVEKVSERIDILKGIADSERASRAAAEKFGDEVRDQEGKVINLQVTIKKAKDIIANCKSNIEILKKDSIDRIAKFASTTKSI